MIESTEKLYTDTKLYMKGLKKMDSQYKELAIWVNKEFNVNVVNIILDKINGDTPRLNIIFEHHYDEAKMMDKDDLNFDINFQKQISKKFKNATGELENEYIFVCYHSFSPIAIEEVNKKIPEIELINFKKKYSAHNIWEIYRVFDSVTVFYYRANQVIENKRNGMSDLMKQDYLKLLKKHDEFGYISLENFEVNFDSKENLDRNYEGSFFYFFR